MNPLDLKISKIGLSGIAVLPQRRAVRPDVVDQLVGSMRDVGLINPITLRPREGGMGYYLIAGRHRYEAARKLNWEGIPAIVIDGIDADQAELREIDENLIRSNLSPAEEAAHHLRRKELYEKRHPETKRGHNLAKKGKGSGAGKEKPQNADTVSYSENAAKKTGTSRDTVERSVKRAREIPDVAELAGTSLDQGAELDALVKLGEVAPERQAKLIEKAKDGEKVSAKAEVKKVQRDTREAELGAKQMALPSQKFGVILEDYEWDDDVWSRDTGMDRHASNHYPTGTRAHTAEEIHLATKDRFSCAARDCVLFMWTTIHHLAVAPDLMKLRGFTYKSHYIWCKPAMSLGRWTRSKHEVLLQGNVPCPAQGTQWESLVAAPHPGPHSAKPDRFYEMIEAYYPSLPKIELNARKARPGWVAWGLDAPIAENQPTQVEESPRPAPAADDSDLVIPEFLRREQPASVSTEVENQIGVA